MDFKHNSKPSKNVGRLSDVCSDNSDNLFYSFEGKIYGNVGEKRCYIQGGGNVIFWYLFSAL